MIGCSFVVDREYFGEIGLLDPGMEVYGGENIELGMRVRIVTRAAVKMYSNWNETLINNLKCRPFFFFKLN